MNRRGFLKLLALGAVAAPIVKQLGALAIEPEAPAIFEVLTYKGVPLVFDQYCHESRIYFICTKQMKEVYERCINGDGSAVAAAHVAYVPYRDDARRREAPVGTWGACKRSSVAAWRPDSHLRLGSGQSNSQRNLSALHTRLHQQRTWHHSLEVSS